MPKLISEMINELSQEEKGIFYSVRQIINDWDAPELLRFCGCPEDEYDSYSWHIYQMLCSGTSRTEITRYLSGSFNLSNLELL